MLTAEIVSDVNLLFGAQKLSLDDTGLAINAATRTPQGDRLGFGSFTHREVCRTLNSISIGVLPGQEEIVVRAGDSARVFPMESFRRVSALTRMLTLHEAAAGHLVP